MATAAKVLVVDDDQDFRTAVRSLLESDGYTVIEAGSGAEGLRKLAETRPDVILLDVMMECSCEGYGINQAIKYQDAYAEFRDIPVIMISSIEEAPDERFPMCPEVEMIRPDRYLRKPLEIPRFLEVVKKAVASRHTATLP